MPIHHMAQIRAKSPVNKQTRIEMSHKDYVGIEDQSKLLASKPVFRVRPPTEDQPHHVPNLRGYRYGHMTVIGWINARQRHEMGWGGKPSFGKTGGIWVVKCDCGNYEPRSTGHIRRPSKKEYVDACTYCKSAWAIRAKHEFKVSGIIPDGGLPTHKSSMLLTDDKKTE